jgi:cytochrome c-type biogenesis protein CcmH
MGWLFALAFALSALAGLGWLGRLSRSGLELALASALIGIAGYIWQGSPSQAGTPVVVKAAGMAPQDRAALTARQMTMNRYGDAARVVEFADTLDRLGLTREAVIAVKTGLRKEPNNVDLWVALGNALVVHGGNTLSPAAEYAFQRGAQLSPDHPAPAFFLGQALAQSGKVKEAGEVWRGLLARTPPNAAWRRNLEEQLAAIDALPEQR